MQSILKTTAISYLTFASGHQFLTEVDDPQLQKTKHIFDSSFNSYAIPSQQQSYNFLADNLWQSNHSVEQTKTHKVTSSHWSHYQDVAPLYQQKNLVASELVFNQEDRSLENSFKTENMQDFCSTLKLFPIEAIDSFLDELVSASTEDFTTKQISMLEQLVIHASRIPENWMHLIRYIPSKSQSHITECFLSHEAPIPKNWMDFLTIFPNEARYKAASVFISNSAPIPKNWMDFLKNFPRSQRHKAIDTFISNRAPIPENWMSYLQLIPDDTKCILLEFIITKKAPIPEYWMLYFPRFFNDEYVKAMELFITNNAPVPINWMTFLEGYPKNEQVKIIELFVTKNAPLPVNWIHKLTELNLSEESTHKLIEIFIEHGAPIPKYWLASSPEKQKENLAIFYLEKAHEFFNKKGLEFPEELLEDLLSSKSEKIRAKLAKICKENKLPKSFFNQRDSSGITFIHKEAREGNLDILDCFLPQFDESEILLNPKAFFSLETLRSCNSSSDIELLAQIPPEELAEPLTVAQNFCEAKVRMKNGSIRTFKHTKAKQVYQQLAARMNPNAYASAKTWTIYMSPDHAFGALGKDTSFGLYPTRNPLTTLHMLPYVGFSRRTGLISSEDTKIEISDSKNFPKITFFISEDQENAIQVKTKLQHTSYHVIFRNCVSFIQEVYATTKASGYFADFLTPAQFQQFNLLDFDNYKALGIAYIESTYGTEIPEIMFINTIIVASVLALKILKGCFVTLAEEMKSIRTARESLFLQLNY